jgi:AcrR family transcriptional regulator
MPDGGGAIGHDRAAMSTRAGGATPSGRGTLGRELIIAEAVRFIDQRGQDRLTMRRLGAELNVEAMALYRYVPGREQLLDGVVEYVMNELYDTTMTGELASSWQEYLQQTARGVRTVATAHPRIFPMVAVRPPAAPWLRPPLRSLRWVECFLETLAGFGFSAQQSVLVYRAFATFLLGHLLLETATLAGDEETAVEGDTTVADAAAELSAYPRLTALSAQLSQDAFEDEFDDALHDLIKRVAHLHS